MSKSTKKAPAATTATASQPRTVEAMTGKPGSKQSRVLTMLQSSGGATIASMMQATGWQQHSVRGFLSGVVRKRLELKLKSIKVDGTRVYQIAQREGRKHKPRQSKRPVS